MRFTENMFGPLLGAILLFIGILLLRGTLP